MARDPSLLDSNQPLAIAPAQPVIAHVQLRDLLICPREQGVVNYVASRAIVEQDMHAPGAPTKVLSHLSFTPISLAYLPVGADDTLIAAGGQDKEIHLSLYTSSSSSSSKPSHSSSRSRRTRQVWEYEDKLQGSINNSVLLTSLSLTKSNESSVEPRVGVSNNDGTVRLYDVPMRVQSAKRKLKLVGEVKLDVAINHSSISPDGRTLLSVGDSNKIYFHQLTGSSSNITFAPITTLTIPPPDFTPLAHYYSGAYHTSLTASFSTAFSGDGSKFAVASQEGVVGVWDVRSTGKPIRVWQTDKTRGMVAGTGGNRDEEGGGMYGGQRTNWWLSDDPWEWTRGTAPGWCVRSVKFNSGEGARMGKEVMAFTEHTSLVHLVDARTFETHDIIRVPTLLRPSSSRDPNAAPPRRPPSAATATSGISRRTSSSVSVPPESGAGTATIAAGAGNNNNNSTGGGGRTQRVLMRRGLPVSNTRTRSGSRAGAPDPPSANSSGSATTTTRRPARSAAAAGASTSDAGAGSTSTNTSTRPPSPPPTTLDYLHPPLHQLQLQHQPHQHQPHHAHPPSPLRLSALPSSAVTSSSGGSSRMESRTHTPGIVQALGDAFRIPLPLGSNAGGSPAAAASRTGSASGGGGSAQPATGAISRASSYSPPASIGDSTWRTLGGGAIAGRSWSPSPPSTSASTTAAAAAATSAPAGTNTTNTSTQTRTAMPSVRDIRMDNYREWARLAVQELGRTDVEPWRRRALEGRLARGFEEGDEGENEEEEVRREREREQEEGDDGPTLEDLIRALRRAPVVHRLPPRHRARAPIQEEQEEEDVEEEEEEEGIVVVPDLGDRDVESEVHALLTGHGIQSRLASEIQGDRYSDDGQSTAAASSNTINATTTTTAATVATSDRTPSPPTPTVGLGPGSGDVNRLFDEVIQRRRAARSRRGVPSGATVGGAAGRGGAGAESANGYAWMMAGSDSSSSSSDAGGFVSGGAGSPAGAGAGRGEGMRRVELGVPSEDDDEHEHEHDEHRHEDLDMMDVDEIDADHDHDHGHHHAGDDIVVDIEEEDSDSDSGHALGPIYALGGGTGLVAGLGLGGGDVRLDEDVFGTDLEYLDEEEDEREQHHLPRQRRLGFHHYMEEEEEQGVGHEEEGEEEVDEEEEEDGEGEGEEGYVARRGIRQGGGLLAALDDTPFPSTSTASTSAVSTSSRYGMRRLASSNTGNNQNKRHLTSKSSSRSSAASRKYGYYEDLDLAGLCFDPWGERMYVAGVGIGGRDGDIFGGGGGRGGWGPHGHGGYGGGGMGGRGDDVGVGAVVEWGVRGAEKRWWVDDGWM